MVIFSEMSARQAKAHLERYLEQTPGRLEELGRRSVASGGPSSAELDGSFTSLQRLWLWMQPRTSWRPGYTPTDVGDVPAEVDEAQLDLGALPEWVEDDPQRWGQMSDDTLWLLDDLSRYVGVCAVTVDPAARWDVGAPRRKGYVYRNHPVIAREGKVAVEPLHVMGISLQSVLGGETDRTPPELFRRNFLEED